MRYYERVGQVAGNRGESRAAIGRLLGISGQAVTLKLQGKRPFTVAELEILGKAWGVRVSEFIGDDLSYLQDLDERDWLKLWRLMTPEQRELAKRMVSAIVAAPPKS